VFSAMASGEPQHSTVGSAVDTTMRDIRQRRLRMGIRRTYTERTRCGEVVSAGNPPPRPERKPGTDVARRSHRRGSSGHVRAGRLAAVPVWETGRIARPSSLTDKRRSRLAEVLAVSLLALFVGGCGGAIKPSERSVSRPTDGRAVAGQLTSNSCSASEPSTGGREVRHCEFVLSDRSAFNCNMASLHTLTPTATEVEHSKACVSVGRISPPVASAAVVDAIAKAHACLAGNGLAVHGGPVPPEGHGPGGPEGELITSGALIAFYADARIAKQAEPEVLREARGLGATVDRRNAVTVLWLPRRPPLTCAAAWSAACSTEAHAASRRADE
jgi:hypothetical protein